MTKQILALILVSLYLVPLTAQEPAQLYLTVYPADAKVRIDGQDFSGDIQNNAQRLSVELTPGTHLLEFWHPRLELESEEITLAAGESREFSMAMRRRSAEYLTYNQELKNYNRDKVVRIFAPVLVGGINAAGWLLVLKGTNTREEDNILDNIEVVRNNYANSIGAVELSQNENAYNELVAEYEELTSSGGTRRAIGIPVMVGVGYLSFKLLQGLYRREGGPPPVFTPGSPFSLDYAPGPAGQSITARFTF